MHCTAKKTLRLIIRQGNHYLVSLKKDHPLAYAWIEEMERLDELSPKGREGCKRISRHIWKEKNKGREERRMARVFAAPRHLQAAWSGLKEIVVIKRSVRSKNKTRVQRAYFLSSSRRTAKQYNELARQHWAIENGLHRPKDVTMREDFAQIRAGHGPVNMAILRNICYNILKLTMGPSIEQAINWIKHDNHTIIQLLNSV